MTQPTITLPREVVEMCLTGLEQHQWPKCFGQNSTVIALIRAALDAPAKPDKCNGCVFFTVGLNTGNARCVVSAQNCTNFDQFRALPPIVLTEVTK